MAGGNPSCLLAFAKSADSTWHQADIIVTMSRRLCDVLDKYTARVLHVIALADPPIDQTLLAAVLHMSPEIVGVCVENLRKADVLRDVKNGLEFRVQALKLAISLSLSATKRRTIHSNWYRVLLPNEYPLVDVGSSRLWRASLGTSGNALLDTC